MPAPPPPALPPVPPMLPPVLPELPPPPPLELSPAPLELLPPEPLEPSHAQQTKAEGMDTKGHRKLVLYRQRYR